MLIGHRKALQLFGRSVAEWRKTHENETTSKYAKYGSRFEPSSPSRVDLNSRKVGLQITDDPYYLNGKSAGGGDPGISLSSMTHVHTWAAVGETAQTAAASKRPCGDSSLIKIFETRPT